MPGIILAIAAWLGISPLRLIIYGAVVVSVVTGAAALRHHYIADGWNRAIVAVKKQDDKAKAAAEAVDTKANECSATSFWDVISQSCKDGQ